MITAIDDSSLKKTFTTALDGMFATPSDSGACVLTKSQTLRTEKRPLTEYCLQVFPIYPRFLDVTVHKLAVFIKVMHTKLNQSK